MIFKVLLVRHKQWGWTLANKELSSIDAHWLNISLIRSVPQGAKAGWVGVGRKRTATREGLSVEVHSGKVLKKPTKAPIRENRHWANTMKTLCFPPNLLSLCTCLPQVGEKWSKERKKTDHTCSFPYADWENPREGPASKRRKKLLIISGEILLLISSEIIFIAYLLYLCYYDNQTWLKHCRSHPRCYLGTEKRGWLKCRYQRKIISSGHSSMSNLSW